MGKFADDIKLREMLYLRFVRSPYAHAKISVLILPRQKLARSCLRPYRRRDRGANPAFHRNRPRARRQDPGLPSGGFEGALPGRTGCRCGGRVCRLADDAAEAVQVEYEALDPVVDAEEALTDASILHEEAGTNRVWNGVFEYGDVEKAFKDAASIVNIDRMHFHRFSSTPLENNVVIAQWDPKDERIYYWCNNSFPSFAIQFLAAHLNVHIDRIRVADFRYRRQLRHQDHELSADGGVRAGFEKSGRTSG